VVGVGAFYVWVTALCFLLCLDTDWWMIGATSELQKQHLSLTVLFPNNINLMMMMMMSLTGGGDCNDGIFIKRVGTEGWIGSPF